MTTHTRTHGADAWAELLGRVPLVIGTAGHRDLREADIPILEKQVDEVFIRIERDYAGGGETPIVLLSSLAEGADQLVARVALKRGIKLIAPLPMPQSNYRHDFQPGLHRGAAAGFEHLLHQAIAAPIVHCAETATRDEQYRAAGIFIAQHSHLMLALWDGDDTETKVGGTADTIRFFTRGLPLDISGSGRRSLDLLIKGALIHVFTPRSGKERPAVSIETKPWWSEATDEAEATSWEIVDAILRLTARFNREAASQDKFSFAAARDKSMAHLFADPVSGRPVDAAMAYAQREGAPWCTLFTAADVLAQRCRTHFKADWILLSVLALAALLSFELATHVAHNGVGIAAYAGWLLAAGCVVLFAYGRQHQPRFLDYRALAEALRIAVFWKLLGSMPSAANRYPLSQQNELAWVKLCLRSLELVALARPKGETCASTEAQRAGWLRSIWLIGQSEFYQRRGAGYKQRSQLLKAISAALAILSPAIAAAWVGWNYWHLGSGAWDWTLYEKHRWLIFAIGILPGFAAAFANYSEQLAFEAQAHQYERMHVLFERARELTMHKAHGDVLRDLYEQVGLEAMQENAEWVSLYRQRPMRIPRG